MMKSMQKFMTKKSIALLVLLAVACLAPLVISSNYYISVLVTCLLYASMGTAWNLFGGYGGHVSWCHAAFVAVEAYTCFILYNSFGLSPFLSMPVAMAICLVFATIMGRVTLRYRGPFFSISTVVFMELLRICLLYFRGLTNGSAGIVIAYTEPNPWKLLFSNDLPYYYIAIVLLLVCLFINWRFLKARIGYYLQMIKDDQDAALSLGVDTGKVKLRAFQISAVMASVVGTIYALFLTYIDPSSIASSDFSIRISAVAIVGGMGKFWGPLLGAFIVIPLSELARVLFPDGGAQLVYGLGLIFVMVINPGGLISLFDFKKVKALFHRLDKAFGRDAAPLNTEEGDK